MADINTEKAGDAECVPMSITSGVGLVSQIEKFGRVIAGDSYRSYLLLQKNDFAYNKSATKQYPEGFIALYTGDAPAAVPNSIFSTFRLKHEATLPEYLNFLFLGNLHGQWLRKFIEVGARAHGSLSVSDSDLLALPVPVPSGPNSLAEQKRIAECLSTLDELIGAESQKLDALKAHKKGLMQQLFPREGESLPRYRFPEFRGSSPWNTDSLGAVFDIASGGTPSRSEKRFWNGHIPWVTTSLVDFNVISSTDEYITDAALANCSARVFPKGTVLMAMYGQGKTRGQVALLGIEAATNQACAAILPREGIDPYFVFSNLAGRYEEIRQLSNSGGQENLSRGLVQQISFAFPSDEDEQLKVTDCLSSLDTLTADQAKKVESLKAHKAGLMQALFPSIRNLDQ